MLLKELFYFRKSDRSVLIVLGMAALVAILLILGFGGGMNTTTLTPEDNIRQPETPFRQRGYSAQEPYGLPSAQQAERFPFDPNTADSTQLLRLGLRPWQVRNIYKYRARGGVYRQPSDFARLYGLTRKQYRELEPLIRIGDDYLPAASLVSERTATVRDTLRYTAKIGPTEHVDLNLADTMLLKRVPGIGSYFARSIIRYRDRLGGFNSVEQLREIEDFPIAALPYFTLSNVQLRKLDLNRLTLNQLRQHPYINFYMARDIIDYRRLKGPLRSLNDLRLLRDFPPDVIRRLEPYVTFSE
ncbi:MAG: helix-hairpin-helix domain-containing protein [Prevotella sp.]|nr:helix-hairpin-helix domain-containing protein [Prevotella sp.]